MTTFARRPSRLPRNESEDGSASSTSEDPREEEHAPDAGEPEKPGKAKTADSMGKEEAPAPGSGLGSVDELDPRGAWGVAARLLRDAGREGAGLVLLNLLLVSLPLLVHASLPRESSSSELAVLAAFAATGALGYWIGSAYFGRLLMGDRAAGIREAMLLVLARLPRLLGFAVSTICAASLVVVFLQGINLLGDATGFGFISRTTAVFVLATILADGFLRLTLFAPHAILLEDVGVLAAVQDSLRVSGSAGQGLGFVFPPNLILWFLLFPSAGIVASLSPWQRAATLAIPLLLGLVAIQALFVGHRFLRRQLLDRGRDLPGLGPTGFFLVLFLLGLMSSIAVPGFVGDRTRANLRACYANQRALAGALEMYALDSELQVEVLEPSFLQTLVEGGYLQSIPTDPGVRKARSSPYVLIRDPSGEVEWPLVFCPRHGSVVLAHHPGIASPSGQAAAPSEQLEALGIPEVRWPVGTRRTLRLSALDPEEFRDRLGDRAYTRLVPKPLPVMLCTGLLLHPPPAPLILMALLR